MSNFLGAVHFARIGRDFYAQEQARATGAFWAVRREWPDAQPIHAQAAWGAVTVERRPVLRDGFVEDAEVVVTADQPLGVWHLQGVELAPVVRGVQAGLSVQALLRDRSAQQQAMVRRWLLDQGCL